MNKFKDIGLMTTQAMKKEYADIFRQYGKIISMPSDAISRLNILMSEIKRKELIEQQEALKTAHEKATAERELTAREEFKEEIALRTELTGLNIKYLRQKYLENPSTGGRKNKK